MAVNQVYFVNNSTDTAVAFDFSGDAQSSDDISLGTGAWQGAVASDNRIYFINETTDTAVAFDFDGNRQSGDDISLGTGNWRGGAASDSRIYFINETTDTAVAFDFSGDAQSSDDISLGTGAWTGGFTVGNRIYFIDTTTGSQRAVAYDFDGNRQSGDDITIGQRADGGVVSDSRIYFVNDATDMAVAYDFDGDAQSTDNISLGTGAWRGGTSTLQSDATLTISTTDTDIRAGETFDVDIDSDIDITDFVASDITVTGGTRGALTGLGMSWTLSVTAGSAGTLTVSIAEDAVSPGNAAASEDFTVNALPTVTITSDDSDIIENEAFTVTFQWSESVSGFATGDVTVTGATKGTFSATDGDTYTLGLTAASGAGDIVVTVAEDAVTLGNAETDETFTRSTPAPVLAFDVPSDDVGNTFTVTLTSTQPLTGVAIGDFILRRADAVFTTLDSSNTTLTAVSGTNNYDLEITLTGTLDHDFQIRLRPNRVQSGESDYPASALNSAFFHVDTNVDADRTLTLSTTDTDIRAGEVFDVAIVFSAAVTGFVASDITVTGGTRGALTGSGTSYTLSVTAGSAGTLNVAIAEDAVSPGNTAASQDFTVSALPTVAITSSDADIRVGEEFTVTFQWSESVSGFATGDVTVSGASKGTFTSVDGDTYTLGLTADSSAGDIDVTVAADAVTLGNAETEETFTNSALPTVAITASTDPVENGEDTTITFQWSEDVSGFVTGDVTLSTGTKGTFTAVDADTYTLVVTAPSSGTGEIDITVAANAVTLGNAETELTIDYQPAAVTPTLGWEVPSETVGNTFSATLTSNVALDAAPGVGDLRLRDDDNSDPVIQLNSTNTTITAIAGTNNYLIELELTGTYDDDYTIRINGNTVQYNGVNVLTAQLASAVFSIDSSIVAGITAAITTDDTDIRAGESVDIDFEFSASVTGFTAPDITVSGGTKGTLTGSGTDYTLSVTAGSAGTLTVSIAADIVTEGNVAASEDFTVNALPTATVAFNPTSVRYGRTTTATITWSESVSGFVVGDLSVDVGSLSDFSGSGTTYTVDITAPTTGSGNITLTIAGDAVTVGNAEADYTVAYSALPTVTVVFDPTTFRNGQTSEATITWSESVTGFTLADLSVDVGSVSNFSGSGTTYTADITAPSSGSGDVTLTIATDAVSVGNAEATATIAYTEAPTVIITADDSDIRVNEEFTVTFEWSETVTGFATGDVTVTGATKGTFSATDGDTYTLDLTADASAGDIVVTVATDAVSEGNAEADETFTRSALPTATVSFSQASLELNATATATITWSEAVSGFALADLSVDVGSLANFTTTNATVYTVEVTSPSTGSGNITLTIAADAVTLGNAEADYTIAYAADPDAITIEAIDEIFITVGTKNYSLEIDVTGDPTDFDVGGNWQGFYYDWDGDNNRLYIKSDSVDRLVTDAEWTLNLSKTGYSANQTIIYNVVASAPVIDDPGDIVFWRGVDNNQFIQIDNSPSEVQIDGDLVGLTHTPGTDADGNSGVIISGQIDEDANFNNTDLGFTLETSNDSGDDSLDADFDILDKPNLFVGAFRLSAEAATPSSPYALFRASEAQSHNSEFKTFEHPLESVVAKQVKSIFRVSASSDLPTARDGQLCVLVKDYSANALNTLDFYDTDAQRRIPLTLAYQAVFPATISDPVGVANYRLFNLNENSTQLLVLDRTDRRMYGISVGSDGGEASIERTSAQLNGSDPVDIWFDIEASGSQSLAYLLDKGNSRIYIYDGGIGTNGILRNNGSSARATINLPSEITSPAGITCDADWIYITDDNNENDAGTLHQGGCSVYRIARDTPSGTTATVSRKWTIHDDYDICAGIWIDA